MARIFIVDGVTYPDPGAEVTPEQFRQTMVTFLPELSNAEMKQFKNGEDDVYQFAKRVGTKGLV